MIDPETPIEKPDEFVGQRTIVRRIFSRIGTERPQSVAVIGGRKTGKTSLLNYLSHPAVKGKHLSDGSYVFCRLSSSGGTSAKEAAEAIKDAEGFLVKIIRALAPDTVQDRNPYNSLRKAVEVLHSRGSRMVFLLDDFHLITGNSAFPLEFFSYLRSLANNYNLAYVTTSFLELQKLCVVKDIEESPFFNIFTNLSLSPLTVDEGCRLLAGLTGREAEGSRSLVEWAGASPYALKLIGRRLQELGADSGQSPGEFEKLFFPELLSYFEQIVSILSPEALGPLKSIAREKQPDPREAYHLRPLIKQGFLVERQDSIYCFSPALALFLKKRLSAKMLSGRP